MKNTKLFGWLQTDFFVYIIILIPENIKDYPFDPALRQIARNGVDGNPGGDFIGEMEFSCGNTTKGNASQLVTICQLQTGSVAGCQLFFVFFRKGGIYNRPYCMDDIFGRKVVTLCDFGAAGRFFMPL